MLKVGGIRSELSTRLSSAVERRCVKASLNFRKGSGVRGGGRVVMAALIRLMLVQVADGSGDPPRPVVMQIGEVAVE